MSADTPKNPPSQGVSSDQNTSDSSSGPGARPVNTVGVLLIAAYLVLLFFFSSYTLIKVWPHCSPATTGAQTSANSNKPQDQLQPQAGSTTATAAPQPPCDNPELVEFFWGKGYWIWDEIRLLLIVMICGALGAVLHGIRSLFWYVGQRELRWSWLLMYILLPFNGTILAVAFYFVIRGGFFPQAKADQSNPISLAALAILIGLFSEQAILKLKQVFETLLTSPPPGNNAKPQTMPAPAPKISTVSPEKGSINGGDEVTVSGTNYSEGIAVKFGDIPAKSVTLVSSSAIKAITPAHAAGKVDIVITNKDGQSVTLPQGYTFE